MAQIIEQKAENKKSILIELEGLANETNLKEIEDTLSEFIEKLSSINKIDLGKSKKQIHKENRIREKLERIWEDKQSRAFWTPEMKLNESMGRIIKFYNVMDHFYFQ